MCYIQKESWLFGKCNAGESFTVESTFSWRILELHKPFAQCDRSWSGIQYVWKWNSVAGRNYLKASLITVQTYGLQGNGCKSSGRFSWRRMSGGKQFLHLKGF